MSNKEEIKKYFLAFDTETGSLDEKEGDLLTAYFSVVDEQLNIVDELDLKMKPDNGLPRATKEALDVNKIDLKEHFKSPLTITYSEAKTKLVDFIKKYRAKGGKSNIRAFGYNVIFDIKFIQHYLIPFKEWDQLIHYKFIDVMQHVDFLKENEYLPPELGRLESVVKELNIPLLEAHIAKNDILMTIEVHKKIKDLMKSRKNIQNNDILTLLEEE